MAERELTVEFLKRTRDGFIPDGVLLSHGDLILAANALRHYADLFDAAARQGDAFVRASRESYAKRCRKIANTIDEATGYDPAAAARRCEKLRTAKPSTSDVGDEALAHIARGGIKQSNQADMATI